MRTRRQQLRVTVFSDGDEPSALALIVAAWDQTWKADYGRQADLEFSDAINLKLLSGRQDLPAGLARIERIRNPDMYFAETTLGIELGGIEITTHSPDGSNIEKRYPLLWAAPQSKTNAFVATPYLKRRPGGQVNRFPWRHAERNLQFASEWDPGDSAHSWLRQFILLRDLHLGDLQLVPDVLRQELLTWTDLGNLFAHLLAARACVGATKHAAEQHLVRFRERLLSLASKSVDNASRRAEASTLLRLPERWIQIYNSRPDSGHWERGEGQFDSIDGRLMFTLDEISFMDAANRPTLEFWLPQMVSTHPWFAEQRARGFESKRLRNILVELAPVCPTKFADTLTTQDWDILHKKDNARLLLERMDWKSETYSITKLVPENLVSTVAKAGITSAPTELHQAIESMLRNPRLYYCAVRAYVPNWRNLVEIQIKALPSDAIVLAPRLPKHLLRSIPIPKSVRVIAAENCTREHLRMLRQLHRTAFA